MPLEKEIESLQLSDKKYYFLQFEKDVQIVFDQISKSKDVARIEVNILKGNIYLKGDYFIPLKSAEAFRLGCTELVTKLKTMSNVLDVELDSNHNLTFRLKRSMVYRAVLEEVTSLRERYGMFSMSKSVLVLTNEEKQKSLDDLRNKLLAEHAISILSLNGCWVYYDDFKPDSTLKLFNSSSNAGQHSLTGLCKDFEDKIHTCDYKFDSDEGKTCLDAKRFIEDNNLSSTYGNALTSIIFPSDNFPTELLKTRYMMHMIQNHLFCPPDVIVHITSQGQNRSTFKAGVLLNMLGGCTAKQVYIFSQSVQYKGKYGTVQGKPSDGSKSNDIKDTVPDSSTQYEDSVNDHYGHCKNMNAVVTNSTAQCEDKCKRGLVCSHGDFAANGTESCSKSNKTPHTGIIDLLSQYKASSASSTAGAFVEAHRVAIERATVMKYETYHAESEVWSSRVQSLTDAAVKFDVLKQNHASVLNLRPPSGCDGGEKTFGVFAQYNYARLSNLFRNFDLKVADGTYHPLCPLEDADFDLLELEEEWHLFSYVLSFPKLVKGVLEALVGGDGGRIRLNKVCLMLQELCQCLSLYYGRIRILSGSQPHLQRGMNARLWMLRGIQQVFRNAFQMLCIEGLDLM